MQFAALRGGTVGFMFYRLCILYKTDGIVYPVTKFLQACKFNFSFLCYYRPVVSQPCVSHDNLNSWMPTCHLGVDIGLERVTT